MYLLTLKVKPNSKFDLALEDVRAYARPENAHRFELADWDPSTKTIVVLVHDFKDLFYLCHDMTVSEPSLGQYNRIKSVRASHVTNDEYCLCTVCGEGSVGLDYIMDIPA